MVESNPLSGFAIVAGMPSEALAEMGRRTAVKTFGAGDVLFEEGVLATELYGLLEGEVTLSLVFQGPGAQGGCPPRGIRAQTGGSDRAGNGLRDHRAR